MIVKMVIQSIWRVANRSIWSSCLIFVLRRIDCTQIGGCGRTGLLTAAILLLWISQPATTKRVSLNLFGLNWF